MPERHATQFEADILRPMRFLALGAREHSEHVRMYASLATASSVFTHRSNRSPQANHGNFRVPLLTRFPLSAVFRSDLATTRHKKLLRTQAARPADPRYPPEAIRFDWGLFQPDRTSLLSPKPPRKTTREKKKNGCNGMGRTGRYMS
jgi:hypothetical protein